MRRYLCIDLKSFYASVECVERGLDPMTAKLVVADPERSDKTICLAVSPAMKALGVKNRCRVFEIPEGIDYITAEPRMKKYIEYSAEIYGVYLRYISKDDIHVYSIDEAFLDVTPYLGTYGLTAREMAVMLMDRVYEETGIRATCGIGTNLYLAKIALDITAKHSPDFIGELDESSYREKLRDHTPITDFWRIGPGTARRLAEVGIHTMGQIAETAERDADFLYRRFGVDAELLIDHANGIETVTIADIKRYRPKSNSLSSGQVLMRDYSFDEGRLVLREMVEQLCLELVKSDKQTDSISLYAGFSNSLRTEGASGTVSLARSTNASGPVVSAALRLYDDIVDSSLPIRRFNVSCSAFPAHGETEQLTFFDGMAEEDERDVTIQKTLLEIKERFGKSSVFKAMDLEEGATALERNRQIGGHKSGEDD